MRAGACGRCGGSPVTDAETGEVCCRGCGFVMTEPSERMPEQDVPDARHAPARMAGDQTVIGGRDADSAGGRLSAGERIRMGRMRRLDGMTQTASRHVNRWVLSRISSVGAAIGVGPAAVESAAATYRRALDAGLTAGHDRRVTAAACVYLACRTAGVPRTAREVAAAADAPLLQMTRYYRRLQEALGIRPAPEDPARYVVRIAERAGIPGRTRLRAGRILEDAGRGPGRALDGKSPTVMAAVAICVACRIDGIRMTAKKVADAAGITSQGLRTRIHALESHGVRA